MYSQFRNPRAPGVQIHAVPESERAVDSNGRRLPWGYDYSTTANAEASDRREPVDKGPFGRSMRRSRSGFSRSRSKTAEPRREEDRIRAENMAAEDAIFGSMKKISSGKDEAGAEGAEKVARAAHVAECESEPTEVFLYGFGEELQWAAIDFYERVSSGIILEDYERQPPGQRFDVSRSMGRNRAQKSLSRAAMRKKNKFAGGEHWIKVTFDSRKASELAISRSPHTIKGYLVYAEPYQGRGPTRDEPLFATQAGVQITSDVLPPSFSTDDPFNRRSSESATMSSATATDGVRDQQQERGQQRPPWGFVSTNNLDDSPTASSSTFNNNALSPRAQTTATPARSTGFEQDALSDATPRPRGFRVEGAVRAVVLPAEMALAPKTAKTSWTSWIGASEIIGSAVPRKENGTFDWDRASFYWQLFMFIDLWLGTDFCGMKGDD
ncbi:uncharacterized protein RCC_01495 [Ramularia collo-cygni]|uniref:Nucleoporin NUP53 n=1 Tax=Ramularia collo-cygni TaxID=112498 RepID=A0A2D3UMS5_9PEZI|nr:uncharacterized protein RCC_01495 [Ramularia collo-cygni]CZT15661.1 uncharacterized protein RCC_01495 [Ramularia collo-cygni]